MSGVVTTRTLEQWLEHAERVHPVGIDMGLERIGRVASGMGFAPPDHKPAPRSVIVAGTNGKGSTCVALEALLLARGLRVGTTLSPHVHRFNERVRIDGVEAGDAVLCSGFAAVEAARLDVPLTYFEFAALVALHVFRTAAVDVAVLEIGLGGRLDAFNLVSADVAVITSIGLDHQAFLGNDLEGIGREKAGVLRPGQQVVLGADVSESVLVAARALNCRVSRLGVDFHVAERATSWDFAGAVQLDGLSRGALAPHNCALAIDAARCLEVLDVASADAALATATLPGRCERWRMDGAVGAELVLDVAHNPSGAAFLARTLAHLGGDRRYVAVVGMLADKDAAGVAAALADRVRYWVCVPTTGARSLSGTDLLARLGVASSGVAVGDPAEGLRRALSLLMPGDAILGFGSFSMVEQLRDVLMHGAVPGVPLTGGSGAVALAAAPAPHPAAVDVTR